MADAAFRFRPEWRISLATAILLPALIGLGFWQLQRAEEKQRIAATFDQRRAASPVALEELEGLAPEELAYRPVALRGSFRPGRYFLLDNRVRRGRYGNEVIAVFDLSGGGSALLNRGWVPADPTRRELPEVSAPAGEVRVTGYVYVPPGDPYLLQDQVLEPGSGWPMRIQALQPGRLARALDGESLFPYSVRSDAGQPGALEAEWPVVNATPQRHRGYAVQWFSMAAVLALFYLFRSSNLRALLRGDRGAGND